MKDKISCDEVIKKKEDFFDQKLEYDQMAEIDKHLEACENCRNKYSEYEKELMTPKSSSTNYDFSKYEYALTLKIIGKTLKYGAITLCIWYILTGIIFPLLFSNQIRVKSEKAQIALQDLVAFTMPGYITGNSGTNSGPWNHKIKIDLRSTLLHDNNYAGYIDAAVPMYVGEADIKLVDVYKSGNRYLLPSQQYYLDGNRAGKGGIDEKTIKKLASFPEGTITQFSLSFNRPINALEMDSLVNALGVPSTNSNNCWVAVDTGIDITKNENMLKLYRNPISGDMWGFPLIFFDRKPVYVNSVTGSSSWSSKAIEDGKRCRQSSKNFIDEMKLFQEYCVYLDDMTLTKEAERINKYLANNEITFYGAILVAPTKDILKIKDVEFIGGAEIINVDFDY